MKTRTSKRILRHYSLDNDIIYTLWKFQLILLSFKKDTLAQKNIVKLSTPPPHPTHTHPSEKL